MRDNYLVQLWLGAYFVVQVFCIRQQVVDTSRKFIERKRFIGAKLLNRSFYSGARTVPNGSFGVARFNKQSEFMSFLLG